MKRWRRLWRRRRDAWREIKRSVHFAVKFYSNPDSENRTYLTITTVASKKVFDEKSPAIANLIAAEAHHIARKAVLRRMGLPVGR